MWVLLQVLHVAGQVGEQHLHFLAALGLQEEALVVAADGNQRSLSRLGWSISDLVSILPLLLHEDGCIGSPRPLFHPTFTRPDPLCLWPRFLSQESFLQSGTKPQSCPTPAASSRQEEDGLALGGAEELKVGATGAESSLIVAFSQA